MLDLTTIKVSSFPKTTKLLECENGYFTISENGIIRFYYNRVADKEKLATYESCLEQAEAMYQDAVKNWLDNFALAEARNEVRKYEALIAFEKETKRLASYECTGIESRDILNKWLELAMASKKNSVWSVAYKTGLRFDSAENYNSDIEFEDLDNLITYREWNYVGSRKAEAGE